MHLSLWFVTKFMTASAAAVNASVRKEKKNTSPSPALFRSGKQPPRRRKRSKRMPYSARCPGPRRGSRPAADIKCPVPLPGAARPGGPARRGAGGEARGRSGPKTCCPPRPGPPGGSRTAPRGGRPGACGAPGGPGEAEGLGEGGGGRLRAVASAQGS